jgi:hypothetical protein
MSNIGHNKPQVTVANLNEVDRKKLKDAIKEMDGSLTRVAAERDLQKNIINDLNDAIGLDKKLIRRLARTHFKANFKDEQDENNQFEELYEEVLNK